MAKIAPPLAIAFDTETSGLSANRTMHIDKQPEIIEIYAALFNFKNGKVLEDIDYLIKPFRPIDEEVITPITGITNAMLADKPFFQQFAPSIKAFLEMDRATFITSHNIAFDQEMVDIEMTRIRDKVAWKPLICTVEQTVNLKGFRLSLTALHEHLFGKAFEKAHRAKNDVMAQIRCVVELHKRDML